MTTPSEGPSRVVLVGGGVAAAATVSGLRDRGFEGEIVLVSDEAHPPYERPPLSKEFLTGSFTAPDFRVNPGEWYAEQGVRTICPTLQAISMFESAIVEVS